MTHKADKTTYGAKIIVKDIVSEPDLKQMLDKIHQLAKGSHSPKIYIDLADVTQLPRDAGVSEFLTNLGKEKAKLNAKDVVVTLPRIASLRAQLTRLIDKSKFKPRTFYDANQAISSLIGKRDSKA